MEILIYRVFTRNPKAQAPCTDIGSFSDQVNHASRGLFVYLMQECWTADPFFVAKFIYAIYARSSPYALRR